MRELRNELEAIASCELADVLDSWGDWTPEQHERLCRYLRAEMGGYGLLSVAHGREAGNPMRTIRAQARRILG